MLEKKTFSKARDLMKEGNHPGLISMFREIRNVLDSAKTLNETELLQLLGSEIYRDTSVEACFFPNILREKKSIALSTLCTGDCLYSSFSLVLYGSNKYVDELRILTCIELFLNAHFYQNHTTVVSGYERNRDKFSKYVSLFQFCVSTEAFDSSSTRLDPLELCQNEAIICCQKKKWSSFMCICALSFVVGRNITTYYPDKREKTKILNDVFNNIKIIPRGVRVVPDRDLHVLFCRTTSMPKGKEDDFKPNHFVSILFVKSLTSIKINAIKTPLRQVGKPGKIVKQRKSSKTSKGAASNVLNSVKKATSKPVYSLYHHFKKTKRSKSSKSPPDDLMSIESDQTLGSASLMSVSIASPTSILKNSKPSEEISMRFSLDSPPPDGESSKRTAAGLSSDEGIPKRSDPLVSSSHVDFPDFDVASYFNRAPGLNRQQLFELKEKVYKPGENFKFPKSRFGTLQRSCNLSYLKNYDWVAYSKREDGLFCLPCSLFGHQFPSKNTRIDLLYKKPLRDWSSVPKRLAKHAGTGKSSFDGLHKYTSLQ